MNDTPITICSPEVFNAGLYGSGFLLLALLYIAFMVTVLVRAELKKSVDKDKEDPFKLTRSQVLRETYHVTGL